ncbi:MAG: hypothetical protein KJ921_13985, partial [Proteobacteria bacterium]|nr:hypothetical protein [Pseudomonadota bacterium]
MAVEIVLPMLGVTVEKGTIIEWFKTEGDAVTKGESLYVVEADKVTTEVESPGDGILGRILVPAGVEVPVLTVVGVIVAKGEAVPDNYQPMAAASQAPAPAAPAGSEEAGQEGGHGLSAPFRPCYSSLMVRVIPSVWLLLGLLLVG